jgi:hypothetical protein
MEKFIIIKHFIGDNMTPYLCSRNIFLDDKIFFEDGSDNTILEGIVDNFSSDNQFVKVIHKNQIIDVKVENCFFPIIEVYNVNLELENKMEISRDKLEFSTICPACEKNSRDLENCLHTNESCLKNKTKPYAFIKL